MPRRIKVTEEFYISPKQRLEHSIYTPKKDCRCDQVVSDDGRAKDISKRWKYYGATPAEQFTEQYRCLKECFTFDLAERVFRSLCGGTFKKRPSGQTEIEWLAFRMTLDPWNRRNDKSLRGE